MAIVVVLLVLGYVKAPPDMAYIISGMKKKSKVVIGKASIRIPFFERLDKLNLRLIPIDVKTSKNIVFPFSIENAAPSLIVGVLYKKCGI